MTAPGSVTAGRAAQRPLRRDAELNRQRILQAAAEEFCERGLGVTLDDVARRAGVGVGTVYRRYPSKQSLAEALFVDKLDAVAALAEQALAEPDPWESLAGFLEHATELLSTNRGLRQILMHAAHATDQIDQARARLQRAGVQLVKRAQQAGAVRGDLEPSDIPLIEFMLITAADYAWHVRPGIWRRYLTLILDGLKPARTQVSELPEPALTGPEMQLAHLADTTKHRIAPGTSA
jgi:AcrR family transcriptional regulator